MPNCMFRASSAVEMTPAVTLLMFPSGCPKFVVLNRLKISARNSRRAAPIGKRLLTEKSTCFEPGPINVLRPTVPWNPDAGSTYAVWSYHRADRRVVEHAAVVFTARRVVDALGNERPALADVRAGQSEREPAAGPDDALHLPASEHVRDGPGAVQPAAAFAKRQLVAEAERAAMALVVARQALRRHRDWS